MEVHRNSEFLGDLGYLEDYFAATRDGVHFMDPLYHEEIRGDQPPRCVLEHPRLAAGQGFLRRKSSDLEITLITALHGQPNDFDELIGQCGDGLTGRAVGVEADWANQPEKLVSDVIICDHPGRAAFQQRQTNWLKRHGAIALPCEYSPRNESEDPLTQKMTALWDAFLKASEDRKQGPDKVFYNRVANLTFWAYQSIRQWAILGCFGHWLQQLEEHGADLPHGALPGEASLILGVGHEPSAGRLRNYFGNRVESIAIQHSRLLDDPAFQNYFRVFYEATTSGHATHKQLDTPFVL